MSSGTGHMTNAPGAGGPVSTIPPAAFRQTPSSSSGHGHGSQAHLYHQQHPSMPQQQTYSPRPPGSLSPQTAGAASSMYTSPTLVGTATGSRPSAFSPSLTAAGPSQLNRSTSLNQGAYPQYHPPAAHQHAQQAGPSYSPAAAMSYQPGRDRGAYGHQQHPSDSSVPYASSSRATASGTSSMLLPTINTQIPTGSFMTLPYSPLSATAPRQPATIDSPYQPRLSGGESGSMSGAQSPHAQSTRPYSMYEHGHKRGSASSGSHVPFDPQAMTSAHLAQAHRTQASPHLHSSHQAQHPVSSAGTALPSPYSAAPAGQHGDTLPLYNQAPSQPLSSPYMPPLSPSRLGAPPRGPIASERTALDQNAASLSEANRRRDRRGTITSADATEHEIWRHKRASPHPPKRQEGFKRVRDPSDLRVVLEPAQQGRGRRADPAGGYVSPLKAMTAYLHHTYHLVNPSFFYELSFNPRRVLTKPSKPMHNDGHDNEDSDYILYVNDFLGSEESNRYLILDILGQGTFGQVVKCQNMKTREIVAVKVIKNKPAYFNQSMMEVTILETLNGSWDPKDEHHILRLRDTFIHAKHLCLVFELLSSNLYELIKQNSFRGLSTSLVRVFTTQLLDALTVLHEARLIHCDLKPENILLKTLQTPSIKLVDFGSACHERQVVYSYIQSRFYRSPEVLLGLPYNSAIDMWSLGCIAVELFLGLPIFPGTSEYNQVCRIVEMLGLPPQYMLEQGKQTGEFFNVMMDEYGRKSYKLKSLEQYSKEHHVKEQPSKRYFQATTLPDIVKTYPMSRKSGKPGDVQKEMANRTSFIDFVTGLLNMDPLGRWTPQQARQHPFITGEKYTAPFKPPLSPINTITRPDTKPGGDPSRHPYGGLPETPGRAAGTRAYQDAAAYNQHLAQQQVYNSTAQARQLQSNNPYAIAEDKAASQSAAAAAAAQNAHAQAQAHAHAQAHAAMSPNYGQVAGPSGASSSFGNANRSRSNTMTRMDMVPPQLAKLGLEPTQLGSLQGATGSAASPVVDPSAAYRHQQHTGKTTTINGIDYGPLETLPHGLMSSTSPHSGQPLSSPGQPPPGWNNASLSRLAAQQASRQYAAGSPQSFSVVVDGQQQRLARAGSASGSGAQMSAPQNAAFASGHASRYSLPGAPARSSAQGVSFDPYGSDVAQLAMQPPQSYQQHAARHPMGPPTVPGASGAATTSNASLNSLHQLYSPPTASSSAGIVPGMILPTQGTPSATGHGGVGGVSGPSDAFAGLGDIVFSPGGTMQPPSSLRSSSRASIGSSQHGGGLPQYHSQQR